MLFKQYVVEGKKILVAIPIFGGAVGTIDGGKLVIPAAKDMVGRSFAGTWVKQ